MYYYFLRPPGPCFKAIDVLVKGREQHNWRSHKFLKILKYKNLQQEEEEEEEEADEEGEAAPAAAVSSFFLVNYQCTE